VPKFVKQYACVSEEIGKAVSLYARDVRARVFPGADNLYTRPARVKEKAS
jgi:ketopantoate hydroxymethyltransferase